MSKQNKLTTFFKYASSSKADPEASASSSDTGTSSSDTGTKRKFQSSWLKEYSWLVHDEEGDVMYCKFCRKAGTDAAGKTDFVTGVKRFKKDTLVCHNKSNRHEKCRLMFSQSERPLSSVDVFNKLFEKQTDKINFELQIKFNTAYTIAKEELPFTKFKSLLLLQKKNGLDIGATYDNEVRCAEIISTIASDMRSETSSQVQKKNFFSVMIDGATDRSVSENESVYIRVLENGFPVNKMVSLIELEHSHAAGLLDALNTSLNSLGIVDYQGKLIGFCSDGAAVNLGQSTGVVAKLRDNIPHLIDIHCMAHRLELSIVQLKNKDNLMKKLNDVLHFIWKTYKYSTKSKRELKVIGDELESRVYMPAPVKGSRWVAHIDRALKIFIQGQLDKSITDDPCQYGIIYSHMEQLAATSTNPDIKGRAKFILKEMSQVLFVAFAHFMADVFGVLSNVSLNFQKESLILPSAVAVVKDCVLLLEDMKTKPSPGGFLLKFISCLESQLQGQNQKCKFQSVYLDFENVPKENLKSSLLEKFQTVLSLIIHEINLTFENLLGTNKDKKAVQVMSSFSIFNHDIWPSDSTDLLNFGFDELGNLVEWFQLPLQMANCDFDALKVEWRQLKLLVGHEFVNKSYSDVWQIMLSKEPYKSDFRNILLLIEILLVLPISSAECERSFSAQKRIKSDTRSSLSVSRLSDLIYISTEGPDIASFSPDSAVKRWMTSGKRKPLAKQQWTEDVHHVN